MPAGINSGDVAWMLAAAALVMLTTPALALFHAGFVRPKNVVSTMMHCFLALAIASVVWVVIGHTLAFGPDTGRAIGHGGWIGGLDFLGFRNVADTAHPLARTVPHAAFAAFEMMLPAFAVAVIAGSYAERLKFSAYVAFSVIWVVVVYAPLAHWVWGGGLLGPRGLGAIDVGGALVVHQSAGIAGLAAAFILGRRRFTPDIQPTQNVPFVLLGMSFLWFGWFGVTGGTSLVSGGLAAIAIVNTHVAAVGGVVGWLVPERMQRGKATATGAALGALSGLVAISASSGLVRPWGAMVIGFAAGLICYYAVGLKRFLKVDDALNVFGVHWFGGLVGVLFAGVFVLKSGYIYTGRFTLLEKQAVASLVVTAWSFALSYAILKIIDWTIGLRVTAEDELTGLDTAQHGESAYAPPA